MNALEVGADPLGVNRVGCPAPLGFPVGAA